MMVWQKLKYLLLPSYRRNAERDMQEELDSLRAMTSRGELGNLTMVAEDARGVWISGWLDCLVQDGRYTLRTMRNNRAFSLLAIVSLALGIGANSAIYSFMEAILFRPLPVRDPESLVIMKWHGDGGSSSVAWNGISFSTRGYHADPNGGVIGTQFPYPALKLFRDNKNVFDSVFCYFATNLNVNIGNRTEVFKAQYVSGDYFRGMGVTTVAGRSILDSDDNPASVNVAVVNERLTARYFASPAEAIGQRIRINDKPFTVIGVTPKEFFGAEPGAVVDVYLPMYAKMQVEPSTPIGASAQQYVDLGYYWIEIMGRLKAGITRAQAEAVSRTQFGNSSRLPVRPTVRTHRCLNYGSTRAMPAWIVCAASIRSPSTC